ncbi:unnamed protein product [Caenorhabditis bovis]|uniref:Uncharacterized protein n=1 Tax=Caenorhabditis bovis TaxID=2654633 RepID=A0A8S1F0B8_9PELO|nr:unnamed protein product [Caenorhabditis bovis]
MHGPKRIFTGKGLAQWFWTIIVSTSLALLILQIVLLLQMYFSKPTLSQVSFIVSEGGMDFPAVTICNFNPVKKSYVKQMNASGDLSGEILEYLLQTNMNTIILNELNEPNRFSLHANADDYRQRHPELKILKFLKESGYECREMFKICYFRGRRFNCCDYMTTRILSLGKCFELDLQTNTPEWMRKQTAPGVEAGLQNVVDAHLEEELTGDEANVTNAIFSTTYENGFRYFVHTANRNAELSSEGVSVSPSRTVYSAIKTTKHNLLSKHEWGNCTNEWPANYTTHIPYSATACQYICLAQYFFETCGCAPFTYNIDGKHKICSPFEIVSCMDAHMVKTGTNETIVDLPDCSECHMECDSITYTAFNYYGDGFNRGALEWLLKQETNLTIRHIKQNFAVINIFFQEMFYTSYSQVQATSIVEILSDIGGNMGMFHGMSVITITEISLYLSKVVWIAVSKKRRDYMLRKKKIEKEKEVQIEEVVKEYQEKMSRRSSQENIRRYRVAPIASGIPPTFVFGDEMGTSRSNSSLESMCEVRLDMDELRKKLSEPARTAIGENFGND